MRKLMMEKFLLFSLEGPKRLFFKYHAAADCWQLDTIIDSVFKPISSADVFVDNFRIDFTYFSAVERMKIKRK